MFTPKCERSHRDAHVYILAIRHTRHEVWVELCHHYASFDPPFIDVCVHNNELLVLLLVHSSRRRPTTVYYCILPSLAPPDPLPGALALARTRYSILRFLRFLGFRSSCERGRSFRGACAAAVPCAVPGSPDAACSRNFSERASRSPVAHAARVSALGAREHDGR